MKIDLKMYKGMFIQDTRLAVPPRSQYFRFVSQIMQLDTYATRAFPRFETNLVFQESSDLKAQSDQLKFKKG